MGSPVGVKSEPTLRGAGLSCCLCLFTETEQIPEPEGRGGGWAAGWGPEDEEGPCSCPGDCLQVALQIRPPNDAELEEGATVIAHKVGDQMVVLMDPGEDPEDVAGTHRSRERTFIFDRVFDQHASQEEVYGATIQHLVEGVISGYNATVFACGPSETKSPDVAQACLELVMRKTLGRAPGRGSMEVINPERGKRMKEGTHINRGAAGPGQLAAKRSVRRGSDRAVRELPGQQAHALLKTQNRGKRMKEGAHINHLLLALGNCANALSEKGSSRAQYVNFRDSKLMRLLKDALGWNSCTVLIAHISPASTYFEESRTTMLYTHRAKNIKTRVKRNLLNFSYRIAQYMEVISDLPREIEHLKSKIGKREKEKKSEAGIRDARVPMLSHDTEEDSHVQMNKIWAQLITAFKEQMEMRRSLVELKNTNIELHTDVSRHLLTIADWEREKTQPRTQRDRGELEKGEEPAEADADGDEGEASEPHEVVLAREEVNLLLAEQRKTAALKAGLEHAKRKTSQMERLLPRRVTSEDQQEVLRLLCRAHELEVNTELQADNLCRKNRLCQKDFVIQRYHQHWLLCEQLIQEERQLIQVSHPPDQNQLPLPPPPVPRAAFLLLDHSCL
ncbi:PREDICTED: kinesin-like protein KIF19 [Cercocebus atys]|uniref:kinesin-like protein KIF19 n=1 Tax=Cercocebus atys TaxID=9531 RepID=UPI0005F38694|nr:PREDICTED: kinesin-like protein KIF19 [Cercocebus atys]